MFVLSTTSFADTVNVLKARKKQNFDEKLCLQVKFYQGQSQTDLTMVKRLGVKWVREESNWPDIEQKPGKYLPLSDALKARLAFYKENKIGVIFILAYENSVAYPNTEDAPYNFVNAEAYANYARYMAQQLKKSGVKFALELWNEPHNSAFATKEYLGGVWHGGPPSPWLDQYVNMVNKAVTRIKSFDASIPVMTDDDMWIVHYFMLDKGLPKALDGFAVHPYSGGRPPEIAAVSHDADWTKPHQVVDENQSFESAVRRLKRYGQKKLGKTPRIWITEWGWRVGETSPTNVVASEEKIASYLPRAMILAASAGIETTCWFSAQDTVDGPMGLKTNTGRLRPAYHAYLKLSQTLGKTQYECELAQEKNRRAFLFRNRQHWIVASWRTDNESANNHVQYKSVTNDKPRCL